MGAATFAGLNLASAVIYTVSAVSMHPNRGGETAWAAMATANYVFAVPNLVLAIILATSDDVEPVMQIDPDSASMGIRGRF